MKIIKYKMRQGEGYADAEITYNDANLEIAKKESLNGYIIVSNVDSNAESEENQ